MKRSTILPQVLALFLVLAVGTSSSGIDQLKQIDSLGQQRGIVAIAIDDSVQQDELLDWISGNELTLFVQSASAEVAFDLRAAARKAGLLGTRVFVAHGPTSTIQLSNNVADCIVVMDPASTPRRDVMRALRPRGTAWIGDTKETKPVPEGTDPWSHPYHGPDNNPQSKDQWVRGSFRTQFIGYPKFSPMPEQTVIAGGRIYKAMGHIAHKANQNEMLNTLLCINAYNGTILWRRPLTEGFMLHRNTMIATETELYLGDHKSCQIIDGATGKTLEELTVDQKISDGPVWKWMAMHEGVLYALVGNPEIKINTQRAIRRGLGHWPWGMWEGHDYDDPRTSFGFGRTIVAIDLHNKKRLWHYRDKEFLDARAVCMNESQIFCYCPGKFLAAIDRYTGQLQWRNESKELLEAIANNQKAQHYITGYATTCYMKCNEEYLFFAGPQRERMVVASAKDGNLQWTHPTGNLQLVLRDDGIWAAGPQKSENGMKFDYASGKILETFPARRACTRATGCADSIFYRANGGTVRVLTGSNTAQHIDPMRPPCQDGVLVAEGHLYWGPWMCGCQLSLYGNIGLRPTESPDGEAAAVPMNQRLVQGDLDTPLRSVGGHKNDWSSYRGGPGREDLSDIPIPESVEPQWSVPIAEDGTIPTAPVVAGDLVYLADRSGAVQCFDKTGQQIWSRITGGPIYYPPTVAQDRVFVGSADGRVYAYAAADGRFLWSYLVGPREERVPVYDHLISAWPVSGGVAVQDGIVYAAAGITHYDGTHVVGLDIRTGEPKIENHTSGVLEPSVGNGVSMQGNLMITGGELRFLAGGVYETARYDLKTLKCLNDPKVQVNSQYRTAFYPYYPAYGKYVSLDYQCKDGCQLTHDASYEGSKFVDLMRQAPLPPGAPRQTVEVARWNRRGGPAPKKLWQDTGKRRFTSFVVTEDVLMATGHPSEQEDQPFLVAIDSRKGTDVWKHSLPGLPVKGGVAMHHSGRFYVSLENGTLMSFVPQ